MHLSQQTLCNQSHGTVGSKNPSSVKQQVILVPRAPGPQSSQVPPAGGLPPPLHSFTAKWLTRPTAPGLPAFDSARHDVSENTTVNFQNVNR